MLYSFDFQTKNPIGKKSMAGQSIHGRTEHSWPDKIAAVAPAVLRRLLLMCSAAVCCLNVHQTSATAAEQELAFPVNKHEFLNAETCTL